MTQKELAAEIGRLMGLLFHQEGSLERALEQLEQEVKGWRAAIVQEGMEMHQRGR